MAFHCEFAAIDAFTVVIVLNVCHRLIGVVVDSVSDVLELSGSIIRAAPQMVSNGDSSFINGIASVHERTLILLDIEALMADRSMGLVAQTKEEVLEPASGSA
jgi:purine-binding chemotaxis protein CheW